MLSIKLRDGRTIDGADRRSPGKAPLEGNVAGWHTDARSLPEGWAAAMRLGPLGMAPWGDIHLAPVVGEVYAAMTPVYEWLAKQGLPPDFQSKRADSPDSQADSRLRYIHRRAGETDIYFVANGSTEIVTANCSFRVLGKQPELWHPETGSVTPLMRYEEKDGCTQVRLRLEPTESVFVVFRHPADAASHIMRIFRRGSNERDKVKMLTTPALDFMRNEITQPGSHFILQTADGRSRAFDCRGLAAPLTINGPWEVAFNPKWGGPAKVTFEKLDDWSKRAEEGIKYYSGAATYRTTFNVAAEAMKQPHARWYIELGKVAVMAEVRVNGKDLGIAWKTPYGVDATSAVKAGVNTLEVKVVNLWINRQIGDEQLPDDCDRNANGTLKSWPKWLQEGTPSPTGRYTFSSWKLWKKGDPLRESGLLGPVTLRQAMPIPR
jgi:hypothetical protein